MAGHATEMAFRVIDRSSGWFSFVFLMGFLFL
jgi:hypothetical protein